MDIKKMLATLPSAWRMIAGVIAAVVVLAVALKVLGWGFTPIVRMLDEDRGMTAVAPSMGSMGLGYANSAGLSDSYASEKSYGGVGLSVRNIRPNPSAPSSPSGDDAEEFEVTDYGVRIGTRDLDEACGTISALKAKDYVIFEQSNERDLGCTYTFKVKRANVAEVVAVVKGLDPRDFAESTRTVKRIVDDYTGEQEILTKKRDSVEKTLEQAIAAYDEIATVATKARDAETLARIIENKLQAIERLTQERINVDQQLDRLARAKAEQLDRVDYVYFNVDVYEEKFVDGRDIADSWREAVRQSIREANDALQAATVGLVALLFVIARWVVTLLILLFVAKYGWRFAKRIWKS